MKYLMDEDDLNGFISFIGAEVKHKGDEVLFRKCPRCGSSAPKDDDWKFSVNRKTGAFGCFRASCGYKGHFVELCRDFGYKLGTEQEKEFATIAQPKGRINPHASALAYLEGRGIGKEVAARYQVTSVDDQPNKLYFPFFDEFGKLVFMKYRQMDYKPGFSKGSKEWCLPNCKPILFGMENCPKYDKLVITEGQIDSMSVAQAFLNCPDSPDAFCSVPTGALGFTWIPHCIDWVKKFQEVVVFGDFEHGKMTLIDTLVRELPNRVLAVQPEDYLGEKDANDILRSFGPDAVRKCVNNAKPPEISHVKELADVQYVDITKLPKVRTGIWELDKALKGGICFGQVVLLTGKRGDGKSTFMSQIMADAIDQGIGVFTYSGELPDFHFKSWLNFQLAGNEHMSERENEFGESEYYLDSDTDKKISEWYRGKAFIYDNRIVEEKETESIIKTVEQVAQMWRVKLFCIDNLMTAMDAIDNPNNLYQAQSNFVKQLKDIAIRYDVAIILVAHPRKSGKEDTDTDSFDNDVVSGSSNITDRVDIVLNYSRAREGESYDSKLQIGKSRLVGILKLGKDAIHLNYSVRSKRVYGTRSLDKHYGWEREPVQVEDIDVPF